MPEDLKLIVIIIIIIIIIISFMQDIYTYIPETNYVPREYSVAAILLLLFMVLISLVSVFIIIIIIIINVIFTIIIVITDYKLKRLTIYNIIRHKKLLLFRNLQLQRAKLFPVIPAHLGLVSTACTRKWTILSGNVSF